MHNSASALVACALAATALTPPQRAVRRRTRLRARTAEGMAPGWKATTDETGAYELIPASYEYRYQEVYVEIPRTAESPGLGVLLEQFGTLDAENGGLTLVAGLVEGGNAANANVDLLPGDSIVKAGTTRVECLDYDATVDALMALPPAPAPAGLMVKRLVKVPFVNIKVMFPRDEGKADVTFKMRRGASLRAELLRNRVEMPTCCEDMNCLCNCRCRVDGEGHPKVDFHAGNCAVQVRKGAAVLEPPSTQEAQMIKKEPYWRLTCRACVARDAEDGSELVIRVRPDLENVMRRKNPFGIETSFKF